MYLEWDKSCQLLLSFQTGNSDLLAVLTIVLLPYSSSVLFCYTFNECDISKLIRPLYTNAKSKLLKISNKVKVKVYQGYNRGSALLLDTQSKRKRLIELAPNWTYLDYSHSWGVHLGLMHVELWHHCLKHRRYFKCKGFHENLDEIMMTK